MDRNKENYYLKEIQKIIFKSRLICFLYGFLGMLIMMSFFIPTIVTFLTSINFGNENLTNIFSFYLAMAAVLDSKFKIFKHFFTHKHIVDFLHKEKLFYFSKSSKYEYLRYEEAYSLFTRTINLFLEEKDQENFKKKFSEKYDSPIKSELEELSKTIDKIDKKLESEKDTIKKISNERK